MTNKEAHVLAFWRAKLKECQARSGLAVSAGEVARHVSQSNKTAKKYLDMLVREGRANQEGKIFPNGVKGKVYFL